MFFACKEIEIQKCKGEMEMAEYKHPEVLVTTEWVAQNLNAPNTRLVEVDVGHIGEVAGRIGNLQ